MNDKKTCLVLIADEHVVDYAKTLLKSVSANYHGVQSLKVFILSPKKVHYRQEEFSFRNLDVEFAYPEGVKIHEDDGFVARMYSGKHFTGTSIYRYYVGNICTGYEKAIYIDVDCVIARDIQPLLDFELVSTPIAAFPEIAQSYPNNPRFRDTALFNAGVMVIDLDYFRKNTIEDVLMERSRTMTDWIGYADQDVFNDVFRNNWSALPVNFNYLVNIYSGLDVPSPVVVHFAGYAKPWNSGTPNTKWKQLWQTHHTSKI
jgi:lipopolysaccharide biosynthesis glycosyltransferase